MRQPTRASAAGEREGKVRRWKWKGPVGTLRWMFEVRDDPHRPAKTSA